MAERLLNKVAVVTGAGSGVGRAIAEQFLDEGAKVVLCGRRLELLEQVAARAEPRSLAVAGDVTRAADLALLVEATRRRFGNVDVVVPSAGILRFARLEECTADDVSEQFAVNVIGAMQTVRSFLPALNPGSAVLFITGFSGRPAVPGLGVHNAGNAALKSFAQTLAVELAPRAVRVNCLAPGPAATPLWSHAGLPEQDVQELLARLADRTVGNKLVHPASLAEAATFLASDAARDVHAQELTVDGAFGVT